MKNNDTVKKRPKLPKIIMWAIMLIFCVGQLFPLVWMVSYSLCKSGDLFGPEIIKIPKNPQFQNYVTAWVDGKIPKYLFNSLLVNVVTIFVTVVFSLTMGYAFTRMKWKLKTPLLTFVLLGMMIPIHATLLPNFTTFHTLGISDSYIGLIIPYVAFSMPLGIFITCGFLESIPGSIEEAAIIDGCSIYRLIFQIIFPITKSALVTVTIMTFISTWNEFIMAMTYLSSDAFRTLPFAVYNFAGQYSSNYSVQFAVMTLVSLPSLIIYAVLNEQITKGVTIGAVKG